VMGFVNGNNVKNSDISYTVLFGNCCAAPGVKLSIYLVDLSTLDTATVHV